MRTTPGVIFSTGRLSTPRLSTTPPTLGPIPTERLSNGIRVAGRYAPVSLTSRLPPTARFWTLVSASFSWSSKSRGAMIFGDNLAKSRSPDFPAATRVAADGRDVGRLAGYRGQLRGILVATHAAAAQKSGERDFARLSPKIMAPLDFEDQLKLAETRVQNRAVGGSREVKDTGA